MSALKSKMPMGSNMVGFIKQKNGLYREFLPYNEQLSSTVQKIAIFFSMYNTYVDKDLQFSKLEIQNVSNIENTFRKKIVSQTYISCIKPYQSIVTSGIHIDITTTLLVNAYLLNKVIRFPLKRKPFLALGKLIHLIYSPSGLSLMLDLNDMFMHLVYERIKIVNPNAQVLLYDNHIVIKDSRENVPDSLIIPRYQKIDTKHLYDDAHLVMQMEKIIPNVYSGEYSQIFFVYPKHPNFTKYIDIKLPLDYKKESDAYCIRIMPYSFSFCNKNIQQNRSRRKRI